MLRGPDVLAAAVTGILCAVLVARRSLFTVAPGPARMASALELVCALVLLDAAYGASGLLLRAREVHPRPTAGTIAAEIAARLTGQPGPLTVTGRFGQWFPVSLTILGAVTLAAGVLALLAPVALRGAGPDSDRDEIRRLVNRPGGDTLDPFILRRDKRWCFAPDRTAAIGFRCVHGIGLAAGDPVGDPAALPDAIGAFVRLCADRGADASHHRCTLGPRRAVRAAGAARPVHRGRGRHRRAVVHPQRASHAQRAPGGQPQPQRRGNDPHVHVM